MRAKFNSPTVRHIILAIAGLGALIAARPAPAQGFPQPALHDVGALKTQVQGFAGGANARVDPRLVVPRCLAPALSWARADVVRADCASPAWTLYVPIDQPYAATGQPAAFQPRARPAIRRGERVLVEAGGQGWAVSIEAEAERDAEGNRIALKGPAGRRFTGRIEEGGRVILAR
jgi:flagellar basal body P-ring formation protein FlgA